MCPCLSCLIRGRIDQKELSFEHVLVVLVMSVWYAGNQGGGFR